MKRILTIILGVMLMITPFAGCNIIKDKKDDATLYAMIERDGGYILTKGTTKSDSATVFAYEREEFVKAGYVLDVSSGTIVYIEPIAIQKILDYLFVDIQMQEGTSFDVFGQIHLIQCCFYRKQEPHLFITVMKDGRVGVAKNGAYYISETGVRDYDTLLQILQENKDRIE